MLWDLVLFVPLGLLTNTAFPYPFDHVLIFFAARHPLEQAWIYAAIGSLCAGAAGFADVALMKSVARWTGHDARPWNLHRWWFYGGVLLMTCLPIPYTVVRLMLVRGRPHPGVYAAVVVAGRFPRHLAIVYVWQMLALPGWASTVLIISALPFLGWNLRGLRKPRSRTQRTSGMPTEKKRRADLIVSVEPHGETRRPKTPGALFRAQARVKRGAGRIRTAE